MTTDDAARWDERYRDRPAGSPSWPTVFSSIESSIPTTGTALDIACGLGFTSLWLAQRGLHVTSLDVSTVAIDALTNRASEFGVTDRVDARVADLDEGLPDLSTSFDVIVCHMFRDPTLDEQLIDTLNVGGLFTLAALSEVDASPGPFRVPAGALVDRFTSDAFASRLRIVADGEADGVAWIIAEPRS